MFCPSCGTESTGLKYCNRCGANLGSLSAPTEIVQVNLTKPALIIGIILAVVTLGGFALLVIGAGMLATVTRAVDPLIALIFMGLVTILVADILLIRQLSKIVTAALKPDQGRSQQSIAPEPAPQFSRVNTAPFLPAASVTENTTRFLEGDYRAPVEPQPAEKQKT
ncbi:MAG TPA: zinc ribbon domain-containing protein [Pyrinomonadaceae bacterium]|nr:zinc ribbon domain-containing protein [Pyrinomonadaceae bacterium]